MRRPELLAPAGSWESLVAAVQNGADAVYLGGKTFNARHSAANFDDEQLKEAVKYCHTRGVKLYVTVNIILADQELYEALEFLRFLYNIGVDAVIIQDIGLAKLARQVVPELALHASTQMTVHNTAGVELLQELGFERVVLSREMTLEGISEIKRHTGADLEVFVHGALCVCYSGQCLMSSLIGGRSGNRGKCAQPCRLQYQLVDRGGKVLVAPEQVGEYLISPRDLNLSAHIPDLIGAGIDSFKIEGRMKRPEYVATVIRVYRELIDQSLQQGNFAVSEEQARDLEQIFNRDFSTGYFYGNIGRDLMSYKRPNNRGILLGRIKKFGKNGLVQLSLQQPLRVGDGIEVWVSQGGRVGTEVSQIIAEGKKLEKAPAGSHVWINIKGKVRIGDRVFKTHDVELMQRARHSYSSSKEIRKIPLKFTVRGAVGKPLTLKVTDPQGNSAEVKSTELGQAAEKRSLTAEFLARQLNRLGNTPFGLGELECDIDGQVMFPVSVINDLRRSVLTQLEQKRQNSPRPIIEKQEFVRRWHRASENRSKGAPPINSTRLAVNVVELAGVKAAVDAGAEIIYFGGESYRSKKTIRPEDIQKAAELCQRGGAQLILSSPRILQDDELSKFTRFMDKALPYVNGVLVGNMGLLKELAPRDIPLVADFSFNVFNQATVNCLQDWGVERVTLSPELTMAQIKELAAQHLLPLEVQVHGALPLMVTEYCAMGSLLGGLKTGHKCSGPCSKQKCGLKDRKGFVFPLEVDQFCHQHLFNARELCLIDDVGQLLEANMAVLRIDARIMPADRVAKVVRAYRQVLDVYPEREWVELATRLKDELEQQSPGFTKGHYYRGVI